MIQPKVSGQHFFTFREVSGLSSKIVDGSIIQAEILGNAKDGATLVRIGSETFTASGISTYIKGDTFTARISFSGNTVFLHPLAQPEGITVPDVFSRLGIVDSRISTFLVAFFQNIHSRLDGKTINGLEKLGQRFHGKEQRSAEALAILSERGIKADYETVDHLIRCIEGKSGKEDYDFLAFINAKKGQDRHWIIIPFEKKLGGLACSGSIRFLVDIPEQKYLETRMTCLLDNRAWEFDFNPIRCKFTVDPPFSSVIFTRFVVYLKCLLLASGIDTVSFYFPDENPVSDFQTVDLEI